NFTSAAGPIQADPSHHGVGSKKRGQGDPPSWGWEETRARPRRSPYRRVIELTTSEYAFRVRAPRAARKSFAGRRTSAGMIRSGARRFLRGLFYRCGDYPSRSAHRVDFIAEVPGACGTRLGTISGNP